MRAQENCGGGDQESSEDKTRYGSSHFLLPPSSLGSGNTKPISPCRAYNITREMTKIIHPQESSEDKTRYGSSHFLLPPSSLGSGNTKPISPCRAYNITREMTKIIHPQD